MGFTQENKINLDTCDRCLGCEEHCKFGYVINYSNLQNTFYPTIGGQIIEQYLGKDGALMQTGEEYNKRIPSEEYKRVEKHMIDTAREIATLCDRYKTR